MNEKDENYYTGDDGVVREKKFQEKQKLKNYNSLRKRFKSMIILGIVFFVIFLTFATVHYYVSPTLAEEPNLVVSFVLETTFTFVIIPLGIISIVLIIVALTAVRKKINSLRDEIDKLSE